jgi:hypothetical protein
MLLFTRMQLTCTAWVEFFNSLDDGRWDIYRSSKKHESISLLDFPAIGRHKVNFVYGFKHRTLQKVTVLFNGRNATAFHPYVF